METFDPTATEGVGTFLFALAVMHTFMVKLFHRMARRFPSGSIAENLFHWLGEIEIVFGAWAAVFTLFLALHLTRSDAVHYLESLDFTEPAFVFVVMVIASTRPVLQCAQALIRLKARFLPFSKPASYLFASLVVGPLLGSFITEPAAMTVTALLLSQTVFSSPISERFKYAILGTLFVNVSIGGTLTPYAAPPVLMVAREWGWDFAFMFGRFGYQSIAACLLSSALLLFGFRKELPKIKLQGGARKDSSKNPIWLMALHLAFLALVVLNAHHGVIFIGLFLFFIGLASITQAHQDTLKIKEGLLVGFFLGGLVVFGPQQKWWLQPLLSKLGEASLFLGSTALTAITDNAALTYLGSRVEGLSDALKHALVAGAVAGGGLTVIANAPNPAGHSILKSSFPDATIAPGRLLKAALLPTLIAMACLWWLPAIRT